jgi:hypothetical protein
MNNDDDVFRKSELGAASCTILFFAKFLYMLV